MDLLAARLAFRQLDSIDKELRRWENYIACCSVVFGLGIGQIIGQQFYTGFPLLLTAIVVFNVIGWRIRQIHNKREIARKRLNEVF